MYKQAKYLVYGDRSLLVEFGDAIATEISAKVRGMQLAIAQSGVEGIVAMNPTYRSLLVEYDPTAVLYDELVGKLRDLEHNMENMQLPSPDVFEVPTLYGGEGGPDLDFVCGHTGLSAEEVIRIHAGGEYLVYMLGFSPGFSYLGGMDEKIATPRLKTPRAMISGGSVGIAGKQTGIYSIDSPGGWQLIGRTPIHLYDPLREPPIIHKAGDYIKFVPIDEKEYARIEKAVLDGSYKYRLYPKEGGGEA